MIDTLFIEQCKNPTVPTSIVRMIVQEESSKNPYAVNVKMEEALFLLFQKQKMKL